MTMLQTPLIAETRSHLDDIRAEIDDLVRRRAELMQASLAELLAAGLDVEIVDHSGCPDQYEAGDIVILTESHEQRNYGYSLRRSITRERSREFTAPGPHAGICVDSWRTVYVSRGLFEVLLRDGDEYLVAGTGLFENEGHRKAIGRLRTAARHDDIRVRVRDRDVTLIDPLGNTLHAGDVVSAFLWLYNITPEAAALGMAIEEMERPAALERQQASTKRAADTRWGNPSGSGDPHASEVRPRDIAAEAIGMGRGGRVSVASAEERNAETAADLVQVCRDIHSGQVTGVALVDPSRWDDAAHHFDNKYLIRAVAARLVELAEQLPEPPRILRRASDTDDDLRRLDE